MSGKAKELPEGIARFDPNAVYTLRALEEMLRGIIRPRVFLERLGVPRRFKGVILGKDIIAAIERLSADDVEALQEDFETEARVVNAAAEARPRPRGRPRKNQEAALRHLTMDDVATKQKLDS